MVTLVFTEVGNTGRDSGLYRTVMSSNFARIEFQVVLRFANRNVKLGN